MNDLKLRGMNIGATILQSILSIVMLIWLLSRWGEKSPIPLSVSLDAVIVMLIVFTLVTAIFHLLYAIRVGQYTQNIEKGKNWMRWLEYSITATIMLWVIAISSGVQDISWQVIIIVCSVLCMLCGLWSERSDTKRSKIWITLLGWAFIILGYGLVIYTFIDTVRQSPVGVPGFVYAIVIGMCIFYMSFGAIHATHLYIGQDNPVTNRRIEAAYTVDSMVSKTLLVSLLFSGFVARNNVTTPSE